MRMQKTAGRLPTRRPRTSRKPRRSGNRRKKGGLRFEAYVPPGLAEWLLELIEQGVFVDPSEAVFVILGEHKDLEPHADLRRELLKRILQAAMDDPRPSIPHEEVMERLRKFAAEPRPEPAEWRSLDRNPI